MKDNVIWNAYIKGFKEENDIYAGKIKPHIYKSKLLQRAYNIGRDDYKIGDDVPGSDYRTKEQILKTIKS